VQEVRELVDTEDIERGAAAEVVRMEAPSGRWYTGIRYREAHRTAAALTRDILPHLALLTSPTTAGITELCLHDREEGLFVYPTGRAWPLSRVLREGGPLGERAGMELAWVVGQILEEMSVVGQLHGVGAHRSLNPRRIFLGCTGRVELIGYGLPQVELRDRGTTPPADAWTYCPPERAAREPDDVVGDLYSLCLVVFEAILGEPLYQGDSTDVRAQAERGAGQERLSRYRRSLGSVVAEFLSRGLARYRDERHADLVRSAGDMAFALSGTSLAQHMEAFALARGVDPAEPEPAAERAAPRAALPERPPLPPRWTAPDPQREERRKRTVRRSRTPRRRRSEVEDRAKQLWLRRLARDRSAMFPRRPPGEDAVHLRVECAQGERRVRLDPDWSLAHSAAVLVDMLLPTPVGLTGQLQRWYRIVQGTDAWFGDERTDLLDPERPIELEEIPNQLVEVTVQLMDGDQQRAERVEVGTAVHSQFLLSALRRRFGLHARGWRLVVDGRALDPWQVLDDYAPWDDLVLELRER